MCRKPTVFDHELASGAFQRLIIKTTKTPIKNTEYFEQRMMNEERASRENEAAAAQW